jgi:hypothetical protein
MNNGGQGLGFEIHDIVGEGRTLKEAYDDFAEKISKRAAEDHGLTGDEAGALFDANPIRTTVEIVVVPHNQWVKAYWVKAY